MKNYIVYCHTNKINKKQYIGITKLKPERRWSNGDGYKECVCFYNAIKKYGWEMFTHEILFTQLTISEAEEKERYLIYKFNTLSPNGYNLQSGGGVNRYFAEETLKKMSDSGKRKKLTQEHRDKIGKAHKGKIVSKETLIRMSLANIGKKHTQEHKNKIKEGLLRNKNRKKSNKPIIQYDLNSKFIREWESASIASTELNLCRRSIGKCCTYDQETSGGFKWRFKNDPINK